ncbi:uncharacterized protein N7484_011927 [Penicillium longicatenatum]|uniref:uncharacterized protein n=1 Tax=Penicillium longicatenatum TaxID=1561947 RepID=UPI0025465972|nr:uncharacterized protein N7484_011927 [Penicillium longicatenatum]KAJ5631827.1 hypothetical protein N7484_011927 [Penicillium longicatenatum]
MKAQTVIATLFSVCVAASAVPASSGYKTVELSGSQLKSALAKYNKGGSLDVNQVINCTVSYTLALSSGGPPYTIDLSSLDLTNCTYT